MCRQPSARVAEQSGEPEGPHGPGAADTFAGIGFVVFSNATNKVAAEITMPVAVLRNAIASHPFRPAGIRVSADLWKELMRGGQITRARGYIEGVLDSGIDFPVYDKDIFVEVDFDLTDFDFTLPTKPKMK